MEDLLKKLPQPISPEQFHEIHGRIPEIKVHVSSNNTVILWQSKKSA